MIILSFDVGIVNMAYCKFDSDSKKILLWEVFSLVNSTDIENTKDIVRKLDQRHHLLDNVDLILIEKQPKINPKMKSIASSLRSYLVVRGLVDRGLDYKIIDYSPVHKLKCWDGPIPIITVKSDHQRRKKLAIFQCEKLIMNQSQEIQNLYNSAQSKKDDLSDCYLQALSYSLFDDTRHGKAIIIQRKPTNKQVKYSKYSKSNLKYFVQEFLREKQSQDEENTLNLDEIIQIFFEENPKLLKCITKMYGTEIEKYFKSELVGEKWTDITFTAKSKKITKKIRKKIQKEIQKENEIEEYEENTD